MNDDKGFADQLNIETPEQVELRFPIAGVGSRFLALLADSVMQGIGELLLILFFVLVASSTKRTAIGAMSDNAGKWMVAVILWLIFYCSGDIFLCSRRSGMVRRRVSGC